MFSTIIIMKFMKLKSLNNAVFLDTVHFQFLASTKEVYLSMWCILPKLNLGTIAECLLYQKKKPLSKLKQ